MLRWFHKVIILYLRSFEWISWKKRLVRILLVQELYDWQLTYSHDKQLVK